MPPPPPASAGPSSASPASTSTFADGADRWSAVDRPVRLGAFRRNVRVCRGVLMGAVPAGAVVQCIIAARSWTGLGQGGRGRGGDKRAEELGTVVDALVAVLSLVSLVILLVSIRWRRPSLRSRAAETQPLLSTRKTPADPDPLAFLPRHHRLTCISLTLSAFASLCALPIPYVLGVLDAQIRVASRTRPKAQRGVDLDRVLLVARAVLLLATFLGAGLMRRGPELHYTPPVSGTGFGVSVAAQPESASGKRKARSEHNGGEEEDHGEEEQEEPVPNVLDYDGCSVLSFAVVGYVSRLARRSTQVHQLAPTDMPYLPEARRADAVVRASQARRQADAVRQGRKGEVTGWEDMSNAKLMWTLWRGNGRVIFACILLDWVKAILGFLPPYCLHEIVQAFVAREQGHRDDRYAYLMCFGLFVGTAGEAILNSALNVTENYLLHVPVKMTMSEMLFRKVLRARDAKTSEADGDSAGKGRSQVMNLLTIDTSTIASMAVRLFNFTNAILSLAIGVYFLYNLLGYSAFVGIAVIPGAAPFSYFIAKYIYTCDRELAAVRDRRIGAIKEFLLGIKVIKLNAWEEHFQRRINLIRNEEVVWGRYRYTLGTLFNLVADQVPLIAILTMFTVFSAVQKRRLDPATAFVAFTVFKRVQTSLSALPQVVTNFFEAVVSLNRLTKYLSSPEIEETSHERISPEIHLQNAVISWSPPAIKVDQAALPAFALRDLTFSLPRGKLSLCIGPLGSGKTLLLLGLLGEAHIQDGLVQAPRSRTNSVPKPEDLADYGDFSAETWLDDSVAYAPQQAFIQHGSIRANVTFGQPFWSERYWEALRQASLMSDLKTMPDGDLTELGEQGVQISGGQRARINLARCLYSRASTVYLDDPLSAVDAHTAKFIVDECLSGSLLKDRTVFLVTHQVSLCLPSSAFVVELSDGKLQQARTSDSVSDLTAFLQEVEEDEEEAKEDIMSPMDELNRALEALPQPEEVKAAKQVYQTEARASGRVAAAHYWMVFTAAGGWFYWTIFALIFGATQAASVGESLWLRIWTGDKDPSHVPYYLTGYGLIVFIGIIMGGLRWVWLYGFGDWHSRYLVGFSSSGSRRIHAKLLARIAEAPLTFFEGTPSARILNRTAEDMARIDGNVSDDFGRSVMATLAFAASLLVVCIESPGFLLVLALTGVPFRWLGAFFFKLRADLRRLSSTASTPLIQTYNDAINAIVVLRAFGACAPVESAWKRFMDHQRRTFVADFYVWNFFRLSIYLVSAVLVSATGFLILLKEMSASEAGFILSFALVASGGLFSLLEQYSYLEQSFVAAERINEYCHIAPEAETVGAPLAVPDAWPQRGRIVFNNLQVRYAPDLPNVLKGINLTIEPGHRVGVVGATGSGKTTLALSLFRANEASGGSIEIDGLDIANVPIHTLRARLNMIVQEASLCSGTLRDALDISQAIDDYEIYAALRKVHLLPAETGVELAEKSPFSDLDSFVAIEGGNFSQGQRQLLCLARALLKQSTILMMDEATSSVDYETDAKITATIKESFKGVTLLVIAHRLATICGFDRVLVVDNGRVAEYGPPSDLIQDPTSAFHRLCMANGPEEYSRLLQLTNETS